MDENLLRVKAVKPSYEQNKYGKTANFNSLEINEDYEPLSTKNAVKFLLEGSLKYKVCRYCLNVASPLSELDEIFEVARKGAIYKVTLRVIIASVHPFKVSEDPNFPDKICARCVESAISSYMFSQQCERAQRALYNCFDDMYTKFEKLDPLDRPKKRGRQKQNPNPNVLYTEHKNVIDYAEPIIHIINVDSVSSHDNKQISPLECPKCWQVFPDVESLLNHESLHPKSMWCSCRLCGRCFNNKRLYKKHIRDVHKHGYVQVKSDLNTNCRCDGCGYISTSFGEHMQHIAKHKFRKTFEHLLDRSMHRLCAVCLEKRSCMIHMNETIQLSGGYPGINNEQAIYNIVSSTFPEPKSYKYQELLIPTRANIMTINKRTDTWQMKIDKQLFKFCVPTVLQKQNIDLETQYIFIFSDPSKLTDLLLDHTSASPKVHSDNEEIEMRCYYSDKDTDGATFQESINNNVNCSKNSTKETFTSENVLKLTNQQKESSGLCKTCWVFNKPSCSQCVSNELYLMEDNQKNMNNDRNGQERCKYCWLFEVVGKCDYCKCIFTKSDDNCYGIKVITSDVPAVSTASLPKQSDKIETKVDYEDPIKSTLYSRKRKHSTEITISQTCKWQCGICFTNNSKNRKTCFCCDFDANIVNNKVTYKFGANKNLFESNIQNNAPDVQELPTANQIMSNTVASESHSNLIPEQVATTLQKYIHQPIFADNVPMEVEPANSNDSHNLTIYKIDQKFINQYPKDESMDVTYEEGTEKSISSQIVLPTNCSFVNENLIGLDRTNAMNNSQFKLQNMPFQFNIGTSTSTVNEKQRNQRNIRRRNANMGRK